MQRKEFEFEERHVPVSVGLMFNSYWCPTKMLDWLYRNAKTLIYPKSVIRYNVNGLLHKNTILYNVIFLMTVIRKYAIQFVDDLLRTTCVLYFFSTNDRFGINHPYNKVR